MLASRTTITRRLMVMVCRLDHCFLVQRLHLVKAANCSRTIQHYNKLKTFILVWIRYYHKTHKMQHKLQLSKTSSTCQQMYKICSRIHQKLRTRLRECYRHPKVQAWATHHKPLLLSIVRVSKIGVTCARLQSRLKKVLRISIILYLLSNIIKNHSKEDLLIKDHQ